MVLPEPLGPRKPQTWPCGHGDVHVIDGRLSAEALGEAFHVDGEGLGHQSGRTSTGWPGWSCQAAGGAGLQLEDELFAAGLAEDDRRRVLFLAGDEADRRGHRPAAIAGDPDLLTQVNLGELAFGDKEADIGVGRRQDLDDRRGRRRPLAFAEVDVFDATFRIGDHAALRELIFGVGERAFHLLDL